MTRTVIYRGPGHVLAVGELRIQRHVPTTIPEGLYTRLLRDKSMTLELVEPEPKKRPPRRRKSKPVPSGGAGNRRRGGTDAGSGGEELISDG